MPVPVLRGKLGKFVARFQHGMMPAWNDASTESKLSMNRSKISAILLLIIAGGLFFILAASLSQLTLSDGVPVNLTQRRAVEENLQINSDMGDAILTFMRAFIIFLAIFLPIALIYMLFTKRGRRDLIVAIVNGLIIIGIFLFLRRTMSQLEFDVTVTPEPGMQEPAPTIIMEDIGQDVVFEADPPEWAIWVGSLVVAIILAVIIFIVVIRFSQRRSQVIALEMIAEEAQQAIDMIHSGGDVRETIINCYREMLNVVKQTRGIIRAEAMTAEEFGELLKKKGLPSAPLQRLTLLFEEVRYGNHDATKKQEQLAVMCLEELVDACELEERKR